MITRIELTNYMSHKSTVIEPAAGLTVLVGPNNCGKSAIADALRTVCGLSRGDYMVRHGESMASVAVTTSEGSSVTWTRKKDVVSWQVDGRDVHREEPEDLHEKLRLPLVSTEGGRQEFSVHLADQKQPLFLLGMPASAPALFFAASSDARHLIAMRLAHKKRTQDLNTKRKGTEDEIERVKKLLDTLDRVTTLEAELAEAEATYQLLSDATSMALRLEEDSKVLTDVQMECKGFSAVALALYPLEAPPTLEDPTHLGRMCQNLATAIQDQAILGREHAVLLPLEGTPSLGPADHLERLIEEMKATAASCRYYLETASSLEVLSAPPTLLDSTPLQVTLRDLVDWNDQKRLATQQVASIQELTAPPGLAGEDAMAALLAHLQSQALEVVSQRQRFSALAVLAIPPEMPDPSPLRNIIALLLESELEAGLRQRQTDVLGRLQSPPAPLDLEPFLVLLDDLHAAVEDLQTESAELDDLERQERSLVVEIQGWLATNGSCPACGQILSQEVMTSGGLHGH